MCPTSALQRKDFMSHVKSRCHLQLSDRAASVGYCKTISQLNYGSGIHISHQIIKFFEGESGKISIFHILNIDTSSQPGQIEVYSFMLNLCRNLPEPLGFDCMFSSTCLRGSSISRQKKHGAPYKS